MMASDRPASPAPDAPPAPAEPPAPKPTHGTLPRSPFLIGFDRFLAVGLVVLAFGIASFAVRNADFWRHLGTGRLIAQGDYSFGKDPFSFVGSDRTWVNPSWLADLGAYFLYTNAGERSVVVAKALLIALLSVFLLCVRRTGESLWPGVLALGLALLASAPWLTMEPLVLSMFFTGLTVYLLVTAPAGNSWRLPVSIFITFWLWSNCDQWFFVGPAMVALYLIGLALQYRAEEEEEEEEKPTLKPYALALVLGIVACMANPNHVRVWQLPAELFAGELGQTLGRDPRFAPLFAGLLEKGGLDFTGSAGGNPVNAVAFLLLLLFDAVAFTVNRRLSLGLLFINLALLGLAIVHARALPMFAVVAAPTAAINIASALETLRGRTFTLANLQLLAAGRVFVRMGLLLAGLLALAACYPGWLHPFDKDRRLSWDATPDTGLSAMASEFQAWRDKGRLPADVHGVILSPDLADYCAWFAPAEKTFFDSRIGFHAPEAADFERMRQAVATRAPDAPKPPEFDFATFFRNNRLAYLAFAASGDSLDFSDSLRPLLFDTRAAGAPVAAWAVWDIQGRVAVLGLRAQDAMPERAFAQMRFAPLPRAFGPDVRPFAEVPAARVSNRDFLARYLTAAPAADPNAAESQLLRVASDYLIGRLSALERASAAGELMAAGSLAGPYAVPIRDATQERLARDIHAEGLLAVRAARRAVARSPETPEGYHALALAYSSQGYVGPMPELRQEVALFNMARYLSLVPGEAPYSPAVQNAALQVSQIYLNQGRFDVSLDAFKQFASHYRRQPIGPERRKEFEAGVGRLEKEIANREAELRRREDLFLNARSDPLRALRLEQRTLEYNGHQVQVNDPNLARAMIAMRNGLTNKAIEVLRTVDLSPGGKIDFGEQFATVVQLSSLLLVTGRIAEAEAVLNDFEAQHADDLAGNPPLRMYFAMIKSHAWFASGRFRELEELLMQQLADLKAVLDAMSRDPRAAAWVALLAARRFGGGPGAAFAEIGFAGHPKGYDAALGQFANQFAYVRSMLEDTQFRLAIAYLEQGNNTAAAGQFRDLVKRSAGQHPRVQAANSYLLLMAAPQ